MGKFACLRVLDEILIAGELQVPSKHFATLIRKAMTVCTETKVVYPSYDEKEKLQEDESEEKSL